MSLMNRTSLRALRDLGLVAAASIAAASIWASALPQEGPQAAASRRTPADGVEATRGSAAVLHEGYLVDAEFWQEEVSSSQHWPAEGWYRLAPTGRGIEVKSVRPGNGELAPADALFFRMPGARLQTGFRPAHTLPTALQKPRLGQDYELTLAGSRFNLRVEEGVKGLEYAISYGQQTYTYVLGPFDARSSAVRAIADLDGDGRPDFLIDVDEEATYLLLSTKARPGHNLPTAELWAKGC